MKMVYPKGAIGKVFPNAKINPPIVSPGGRERTHAAVDLSDEDIVFRSIQHLNHGQVRSLSRQIAQGMSDLDFLVKKTPDQIFERIEQGNCLVFSSRMRALFFACFYEVAGMYVIDSLLLHNTHARVMGAHFRRFLNFKTKESGIKQVFGLAPKELKGGSQTRYNLFFATNGFTLWDPREEDHKALLHLLRTHEDLGDLLDEAYWIFHHEANPA